MDSSTHSFPHLIVAGSLKVNSAPASLASYDLSTDSVDPYNHPLLYKYGDTNGEDPKVYQLLSNHTHTPDTSLKNHHHQLSYHKAKPATYPHSELIVVGAFDTTCKDCQVQYCSVGKWSGADFKKVGEGLCNSALSRGMKITTASLAGPKSLYVAGSFYTRAWNGEANDFIKIFNIAHFNSTSNIWSPLQHGQLTCSWCQVTVLALAWDAQKRTLHVGGKFNAISEANIPAGLATYHEADGHLVAHPGGGLSLNDVSKDGVATALQFDPMTRVLYVMGSFERLTSTNQLCNGLAAYETDFNRWTCLADALHSVEPSSTGNMLITPHGLMVAGLASNESTWKSPDRPYTIALLATSPSPHNKSLNEFSWSWLPKFPGHSEPIHTLAEGFAEYHNMLFIGGSNFLAMWDSKTGTTPLTPKSNSLSGDIMSIAQLSVPAPSPAPSHNDADLNPDDVHVYMSTVVIYCLTLGTVLGIALAILCNKQIWSVVLDTGRKGGISLDTLSYGSVDNSDMSEYYEKAMRSRHLADNHNQITLINPSEITLHRIIGEGTFGRVWCANWRASEVAVKEFVFAQAAVVGRSTQQKEIIEEIVGEAGTMSCLRHPHILQLFGCSLTSQAIWIVSEVCSLGSLRQVLDDKSKPLLLTVALRLAMDVADGMVYLHGKRPAIIHRDLKSHNIFVHEVSRNGQKNIIAKIGDWGSARAALAGNRTMTHGVGTACWLAPEVIKHARASKFSDSYGFAVILWEMATREEVYKGLNTMQIIARVANEGLRPPIPDDCPFRHIMIRCWDEVPSRRWDFPRILEELEIVWKNASGVESNNGINIPSGPKNNGATPVNNV